MSWHDGFVYRGDYFEHVRCGWRLELVLFLPLSQIMERAKHHHAVACGTNGSHA